jgi:tRNA pseudouridine38-40 synthase
MQRIKLVVEYDGAKYFGWQCQKGQASIQDEIEKALFTIFKKKIKITGSGRTDTRVHARNQIVHLDIPDYDLYKLRSSLNGLLQNDIVVKDIQNSAPGFHARFDAAARRYRYYISKESTAINRNYVWQINFPLNITVMQIGCERIRLNRDFQAFCKMGSDVKHYQCDIFESKWFFLENLLVYEIKANRFLHGMVRAIVGTLIDLGRGKISLSELEKIIESKDRTLIKLTAPPQGLVLEEVNY